MRVFWVVIKLIAGMSPAQAQRADAVEPQAGSWKTWVIVSGRQLRVPPPHDRAATEKGLSELSQMAAGRDRAALDRVSYWDTGAPSYRWSEIAVAEHPRNGIGWPIASRDLALMHIAIYDAMVAAWDSKYAHHRPRPSQARPGLWTVVANPQSPSYPAEHAVAAGAASQVLAYIFPDRAAFFRQEAEEAARSRLTAGVNYPSDTAVGLALGKQAAALVIAASPTGPMPSGPVPCRRALAGGPARIPSCRRPVPGDLGSVLARRVPPAAADPLRFVRKGGRISRAQELPAHAGHQQ